MTNLSRANNRLKGFVFWSFCLLQPAAFRIAFTTALTLAVSLAFVALTPASYGASSKPEVVEVKWLNEAEQAFVDYYAHYVKGVTDSVATFEVTVTGSRWEVKQNRQFSVEAKQEWLYGRFVIYQAKPLTAADELNGVEFDGVVRVEADAIRLTAAAGSDAEAVAVVKGQTKTLNAPWQVPGGAEFERYSIKRVKGAWQISEYRGGWASDYKVLRTHWLCGKPRPEVGVVDEAGVKAELLAAFDKLKRPTTEGGFTLRYLGYHQLGSRRLQAGEVPQLHDLLVEYRPFSEPRLEADKVTAADRANGVEARYIMRVFDVAALVKESGVRPLRAGEAMPRQGCGSPGTEVTGAWKDVKLLYLHAEKSGGGWWFSDLVGEIVGE